MNGPGFIHLHTHSAYSLLEGALQLETILKLAAADNQPALGIADTGNLFGALEFSEKASKKGIQPLVGVLLSGVFFAWKIAQIFAVTSELSADGSTRTYHVRGQLFFASAEQFMAAFDFGEPVQLVTIDLTHAHIWDISSVASIDKAVLKFRKLGITVSLAGLNAASATIVDNLGQHQKADAEIIMGH